MTASPERASMSAVKLALLASQVRAQLDDGDALTAEPIAIIGVGCRYPGGANTPEAYWEIIRDGIDATSEVPPDRWDADAFYDPDPTTPGRMNSRRGGFVRDLDRFDAAFFGISPREAAHMDPQQRMVLEVAIEALERAGQPIDRLAGSRTGVFVASSMLDYGEREHAGAEDIDAYSITGNVHCIIPNRLSYTLDLHGPSVSVDTACSSSLVSVHLACQSLRNRDSHLAIAGGVNALLSPNASVGLSKWGLMAPDGRCKTFDARADGYVRSEGCGVVVLKRLADAIADGDPVVAVIRGSAVNQDGRSTAMTAPNGIAQQDVIRRALSNAQVLPEQVGCVELHGTGTVLGDPIEVEALAEVLGTPVEGAPPVVLTAVKTNIGHVEAGAGLAGLIKTVLCLEHEAVPAPVHFRTLNPHISLEGTRLVIPTELHPWPRGGGRRIAGVSSFGFGGTNAHVLVEEAPILPAGAATGGVELLVLSAQTSDALRDAALATAARIESDRSVDLAGLLATAALRRTHHEHRLAVTGTTREDIVDRLRAAAAGERGPSIVTGRRDPGARRRVAFVCSGQGNQWWAMARDLLSESAVFRAVIDECDALLRGHVTWSLLEELLRDEETSRLERTEIAQPALFAVQVGLASMWRSWGIVPDVVIGHSVGEVAAAHLAGALSLADAVRVIAARGASMAASFGTGAMASVELPAAQVRAAIAELGDRVSIAAINAPDVTVISGVPEAVADAVATFGGAGAAVRPLAVTYPFHSTQMTACGAALARELAGLAPKAPTTRFVSTVTGDAVHDASLDAAYWAANVTGTVRFADAIAAAAATGCDTFVELGPHPVLGGAISRTLASAGGTAPVIVATLRRGRRGGETMAIALGELHCHGVEVDWPAVWPGRRPVVALPTYPWQKRRHWVDTWQPAGGGAGRSGRVGSKGDQRHSGHPLVGARLRSPAIEGFVYETELTPAAPSFIDDHRIGGIALLPGTGFVEMAVAAFATATGRSARTVRDLDLLGALALGDDGDATTVQIHVRGDADDATVVVSSTVDGETWTEHARARVSGTPADPASTAIDAVRARCPRSVSGADLYAQLRDRRIDFGPSFLGVQDMWVGDGEVLARVVAPSTVAATASDYAFHPALLDAAIHPVAQLLPDDSSTFLPIALSALRLHGEPASELWSHVRLRGDAGDAIVTVDISIVDGSGRPIADVVGLRVARASAASITGGFGRAGREGRDRIAPDGEIASLYELRWLPDDDDGALPVGPWLVVADRGGVGRELADALSREGVTVDVVGAADEVTVADVRARVRATGANEVVHLRGLDVPPVHASADPVADQEQGLGDLVAVARALADTPARLWTVTCGAHSVDGSAAAAEQATVSGFAAGIAAERAELRCVRVDLDPSASVAERAAGLAGALAACGHEDLVACRGGVRRVGRLAAIAGDRLAVDGPTRLASSSYGVLDGLHQAPLERRAPGPGEVEVEVEVTGLNFRDVLVALDLYPERSTVFGDECAGVVVRTGPGVETVRIGDRVVAIAPGAFATHITTASELVHPVPVGMSSEAAATIPITFLTAHYALVTLGRLGRGEHVLIHAGAGGVGMAAIQIAQLLGAEVHATAGNDEKRATLREMGVRHVYDSRSPSFADGIFAATDGAGVQVVLNSLSGELLQRSVDVLAPGGRFLEIGRRDIWSVDRMTAERPDVGYHIVFLGDLSVGDPPAIQAMYEEIIPRFERGDLRPLPVTAFESAAVVDAFRFMAQARHTGKIVVRRARTIVSEVGTYLVTGGTGGIGLVLANHLVDLGARHLALVSRGEPDARAAAAIEALRSRGADVRVLRADVAVRAEVDGVLAEIDATMPVLRGVLHAAGVTADALLEDQTWSHAERVLRPKLAGAHHLDDLTADRHLDLFVLMSAASTVVGAPGQANYVAANAALDAIAAARRAAGASALSIGWGAWDRVGMTEHVDDSALARMARRGLLTLSTAEAVAAFDAARRTGVAHVLAIAMDRATIDDRPVLRDLRSATTPTLARDMVQHWVDTVSGMRRSVITAFVDEQARKVLGLAVGSAIPPRQPLNELGLDSLMAVELRNAIGAALGRPQPATLLFDHPTSAALVDHLLTVVEAAAGTAPVGSAPPEVAAPSGPHAPALRADEYEMLAEMSEAEAEALLLAELGSTEPDA